MEKSLRDINLKLKNAERDQENARRKIRDVIQNPQNQDSQRRSDQNSNRPNRGRDDDFRRRDRDRHGRHHGGHFRDRDQNRGNDNSRPQGEPVSGQGTAPGAADAARPQIPVAVQPPVEKEPLAIVPENTEILHGRKVLVRRRILTEEEQAQADKNGQAADSPQQSQPGIGQVALPMPENAAQGGPVSEPAAAQEAQEPESEVQNINFGR